jgi:hypothetical protein
MTCCHFDMALEYTIVVDPDYYQAYMYNPRLYDFDDKPNEDNPFSMRCYGRKQYTTVCELTNGSGTRSSRIVGYT